jgi:hypothetical protein
MTNLRPEEPEADDEPGPGQFRLRTLFVVTFFVAAACSLAVWWGPVVLGLIVGGGVSAVLAGVACALVGLDNPLDELKPGLAKCFALSTSFVWLAYAAIAWIGLPHLLIFVGIIVYCLTKAFWLDLGAIEVVILMGSMILGVCLAAAVMLPLLH